jgi:hypothetical protein
VKAPAPVLGDEGGAGAGAVCGYAGEEALGGTPCTSARSISVLCYDYMTVASVWGCAGPHQDHLGATSCTPHVVLPVARKTQGCLIQSRTTGHAAIAAAREATSVSQRR